MSTVRRTHRWALGFALFLPALSGAQLGSEGLPDLSGISGSISGAIAPKPSGTFSSGLKVPSVNPGTAAKGIGRQLRTTIEEKTGQKNAALQALEDEMPKALEKIEAGLQGLGMAKRDLGVAAGYFFITSYETATGKTIPQEASLAAGRTVAKVVGERWGGKFKSLSAARQESMYETLLIAPTLLNEFATQFEKVGKTEDAKGMRQASAAMFQKLIGASPDSIRIDGTGRISGLGGGSSEKGGGAASGGKAMRSLPIGKLTPSSLGGAQVFAMYVVSINGSSPIRELVLFPDGTAIDDIPSGPVVRFDSTTLRAANPGAAGRWSRSANRLTITIRAKNEVYVKDPSGGWADPERRSGSFGIYFPVLPLKSATLSGPWHSETLMSVGMVGGPGPVTFGGSTGDLAFSANGTYAKAGRGFASTTSSIGDVSTVGKPQEGRGQWRLDGLLLTTVENEQRGVQLAYALPRWSKPGEAPDIMIQGRRWSRPEKK
jgi:hypothetical protein